MQEVVYTFFLCVCGGEVKRPLGKGFKAKNFSSWMLFDEAQKILDFWGFEWLQVCVFVVIVCLWVTMVFMKFHVFF